MTGYQPHGLGTDERGDRCVARGLLYKPLIGPVRRVCLMVDLGHVSGPEGDRVAMIHDVEHPHTPRMVSAERLVIDTRYALAVVDVIEQAKAWVAAWYEPREDGS